MAFALGSRAQALGYRMFAFDSIGSTNAEALARVKTGERGPLWLVTGHQTAGRGRRFRPWIAPPGNLAASVVEVMEISPAIGATLGFAAGLALQGALSSLGIDVSLKWPNDVLCGGAKLSGILLEAEAVGDTHLAVVVGIGVNVVSAPEGVPYAATSLAKAGHSVSAEQLFTALSDQWADDRAVWDCGRGMRYLRERWLARAAGVGGPVSVQIGTQSVTGIFETIDGDGHLVVATETGERIAVSAGDVYFGDAASRPAGAA